MYKPRPIIALTCLLDLLFVLIFSALLMVDPTSNKINGEQTKQSVEKNQIAENKSLTVKLANVKSDNKLKTKEIRKLEQANSKLQTKINALQSKLQKVDSGSKSFSLTGSWTGEGCQDNYSCWNMKLNIPHHKNGDALSNIKIEYPSLNCGGHLEFIKWENNTARFIEKITYNTSRCINNGTVLLTATGPNTASFVWQDKNGKLGAYGRLGKG